jgi:DNA-binding MarR family transcriptional regulator
MNNNMDIMAQFEDLDFTVDETKIYLELLRAPSSHLHLSRATGINRTKVYRIIESLEQRSIVSRRTDDRGTFLTAADPTALEVAIATNQQKLIKQQHVINRLIPTLSAMQSKDRSAFALRHYEGVAGLKQMCWHELKAEGELLSLGNGTIEQLIDDDRWAANHRIRQIECKYTTRELINYDYTTDELPELASATLLASELYGMRKLPYDLINFDNQTIIYNDTVSIYHWKHDQKVGLEIISPTYAQMMRQVFEQYWLIAKE